MRFGSPLERGRLFNEVPEAPVRSVMRRGRRRLRVVGGLGRTHCWWIPLAIPCSLQMTSLSSSRDVEWTNQIRYC